MFKAIYYKFILTILMGLVATHFLFSYLLDFTTSLFYDNTMMNVRNLNENEMAMSKAYLARIKSSAKPVILVLGSSFSYGYGLTAQDTYSNLLEKQLNYKVMNASVIGDVFSIKDKLAYLEAKKIFVDTIIIELNLFNITYTSMPANQLTSTSMPVSELTSTSVLATVLTLMNKYKLKYHELINTWSNSYFSFYLFHPSGFNSFANLDLNYLLVLGDNPVKTYQFAKLPDNYMQKYSDFKKSFSKYREFVRGILSSSTKVANHVYFFISPIYGNGVKQSQFKLEDIERELEDINAICQEMPGINCLNPGIQFSEQYFSNLSHYNEEGHRAFAKWLVSKLQKK